MHTYIMCMMSSRLTTTHIHACVEDHEPAQTVSQGIQRQAPLRVKGYRQMGIRNVCFIGFIVGFGFRVQGLGFIGFREFGVWGL